ncbi:NUDIX hydrolase [Nocardioides jensenii]|uniref:NUDIX hydrolase n=1 Tax=Nocardioides jensenii TaxID=1843 RepID=UPI00082B13F2|nr:NUDIX domain-containing protein [Nocardioides jensenii]
MPLRHAIATAALVRDGRLLLGHRHPQRRYYADCWDLIGGHIEPGESPREAVRRECLEEIGVRVKNPRPIDLAFSDPDIDMHAFLVTEWIGEPTNLAPDEHDDLGWFSPGQIPGLVLADAAAVPDLLRAVRSASGS